MDKSSVIHSDPEILSGIPVFSGSRVPFKNLIDYLEAGYTLDEFLDDFPTVSREPRRPPSTSTSADRT